MNVGVVGPSLDNIPNNLALIEALKNELWSIAHDYSTEVKFVSGGATGIDEWAMQYADDEGHETHNFIPAHKHWDCGLNCYGFKARNQALAAFIDKLYCVTFFDVVRPCYHCMKRLDSKLVTHRVSGGCWTLNYSEDLGKDIELREVTEW